MLRGQADKVNLSDDDVAKKSDKEIIGASKGHQWLTLIGATFVIFEIVFIELYSDNFWFSFDIQWLGIPAILIAGVCAHFMLLGLQSRWGCKFTSPLWKGKPAVVYTNWVTLEGEGFSHGLRSVRWDAIEELRLTIFGNLQIVSRIICGTDQKDPDVIFKFPFSAAGQKEQKRFVDAVMANNPNVVLNARLTKSLTSPILKGQNFTQAFGAILMFVLLFDLGYSSFYWLEMLKAYHQANVNAVAGKTVDAEKHLAEADQLRGHPLPFSYITSRFLSIASPASSVSQVRSDTLWALGKKDKAYAEARKQLTLQPDSSLVYLHLARLLYEGGKVDEAKAVLNQALEKHKNALLPRLYLIAIGKSADPARGKVLYDEMMAHYSQSTFQNEPAWPPGGESFLHEMFHSNDLQFLMNHFL